jgi:hypothetical protein
LRSAVRANPSFLLRAAFWKNLFRALELRAAVSRPRARSG